MSTTDDLYDPRKVDTYRYDEQASWIQRFLWFCAGADIQLLMRCPHSERVKEAGIGGIVLATAVLAFVSGSYAMYTVFGPRGGFVLSAQQQALDIPTLIKAVIAGFVWALIIFNLDRFVVSSTGDGDGTDKITFGEMVRALPRISMAILIAISLSKPLEIRIMKSEIDAQLNHKQMEYTKVSNNPIDAEFAKKQADLKARIASQHDMLNKNATTLEARISSTREKINSNDAIMEKRTQEIRNQQHELDLEASGKAANKKPGEGPGFRTKKDNLAKMEAGLPNEAARIKAQNDELTADLERERARILNENETIKVTISELTKTLDDEVAHRDSVIEYNQKQAHNLDGLMERIQIADEKYPTASLVLTLLLIVIEVAPIFFKMMIVRGPYNYLSSNQDYIVLAKYGIEQATNTVGGKASEQVHEDIYHQANNIRDYELRQMDVEKRLAQKAQQIFAEHVTADIEANPEKYIINAAPDK